MADGGSGALARPLADLREIARRFDVLGSKFFLRGVSRQFAEYALRSAHMAFLGETDPYGTPWLPRKRRGDGHPLLYITGRLYRSIRVRVVEGGVLLTTTNPYAAVHQDGATIPERAYANAHGKDNRFRRQGKARDPYTARGARRVSIGTIGATKIPRRPFFPDDRGVPPWLGDQMERVYSEALRVLFAGVI